MRTLRRMALTAVSILAALLVCELVVRMVAPQQLIALRPDLYRPDNGFGWRHQENADVTLNTGERMVRFRTDANGYRVPSTTRETDAQTARILMLGDSLLEATAVEAEETVSEVLARALTARLRRPVAADNAGVGGWNPNQYLLEARRALARTQYAIGVVLLYLGNDLITAAADSYPARTPIPVLHFRLPRDLTAAEWFGAVILPANDRLEARTHLYVLAKQGLEVPLARVGLTAASFPEVFRLDDQTSPRWETTTAICRRIRDVFTSHGIPALFVLVPTSYQVDEESFRIAVRSFRIRPETVDLEQPNRILARRFYDSHLTFIDPLAEMRRQRLGGTRLYGRVDRHLSAKGHAALAAQLTGPLEVCLSGKCEAK